MVGHYVDSLYATEEDRVLTMALAPGAFAHVNGTRCLVGAVLDSRPHPTEAWVHRYERRGLTLWYQGCLNVAERFDALCHRFGTERTTRLIRARIIENRARRMLAGVRGSAPEVAETLE